ncbi:alpha-amylase [Clostridium polyendosporum]|uniref:Alpha-amylase n=1 Tax=Clostridium polyendosporum TaxID=69208 RepID=A0A919S2T0_9CLOT|nr:alpha-glucosidase [Clostridium polyendosporum]GIM30424.1 alpha-amylase [Clostridium polyendosporum]
MKKWWQKEVIYQIYPKSFYDSNGDGIGDVKGITEKLDYLSDLGVTMLWLCPIYRSPMDDNGYDISDYYQLNPEFGTMEDLDELIEKAKKKNIKIILDLVINHTSDEHPWFQDAINNPNSPYKDYYIFKEGKDGEEPTNWRSIFGGSVWEKVKDTNEYYLHVFSKKQPDLNWENEKVRNDLYDMVNYWLDKGLAGFRVDAITFIKKDQSYESIPSDGVDGLAKVTKCARNQKGIEKFLTELKEKTFSKYDCVTVGEAPGVPYDQLEDFIGEKGYFSMIFDFSYADLDVESGSEWFKRRNWTIKELRDRIFKSQLEMQKVGWGAIFSENHDQPRSISKYIKEEDRNYYSTTMLAALFFFLRGTPFIYQGQEIGMTNFERTSIDDFNDLSSIDQYYRSLEEGFSKEEALHIVNLRSRDNGRTPFHWDDTKNAGFSLGTPWIKLNENYTEINLKAEENKKDSVLEFYKKIIQIRQNGKYSDCLIYGDILPLDIDIDDIIAYQRCYENQNIVCVFNFSNKSQSISLPIKSTDIVLNNYDTISITEQEINLKPFQLVLIATEKV